MAKIRELEEARKMTTLILCRFCLVRKNLNSGAQALTVASGDDTEVGLILAISSIFSCLRNISDLNICPAHRYSL